eukprot:gene5814-9637_t
MNQIFKKIKPKLIFIQGDTTTAYLGALSSFYKKIKIFHVEAGLRTHDLYSPYPEEMNRRSISLLSNVHFSPSKISTNNLIKEGIPKTSIFQVGNTGIDSFLKVLNEPIKSTKLKEKLNYLTKGKYILVTCHRNENIVKLKSICKSILKIISTFKNLKIIFPVHLNPNERIILIEPLSYKLFVHLMKKSYLILTDSGGIQEEVVTLGKPTLILRNETERIDSINSGVIKLIGTEEDNIFKETMKLLTDKKLRC